MKIKMICLQLVFVLNSSCWNDSRSCLFIPEGMDDKNDFLSSRKIAFESYIRYIFDNLLKSEFEFPNIKTLLADINRLTRSQRVYSFIIVRYKLG